MLAQEVSVERVRIEGLDVGVELYDFVVNEALPGSGIETETFFAGLAQLVHEFGPRNAELLEIRASMQAAIDEWHTVRSGKPHDKKAYREFLESLNYLVPEGPDFEILTANVDREVSSVSAPQLVVPATNARYVLNAANARWGSLYDALYGTNALGDPPAGGPYDQDRGAQVIAWVRQFLDEVIPLASESHADVSHYSVTCGQMLAHVDGRIVRLSDPSLFVGFNGGESSPRSLLFEQHGLGIEILIDPGSDIGSLDKAGVADVVLESAMTVIVDFEDSVTGVDSQEKTQAYRNWLGLMRGDLSESVTKNGGTFTRVLNPDRHFNAADGGPLYRRGRALLLARNVGHLMTTSAVLDEQGAEIPEGLLDALVTALCSLHDVQRTLGTRNSPAGSIYVVKPKMHGPDEVGFTGDVFSKVEDILGLDRDTVKLGIMDEERRTTLNLKECIRAAKSRVAFINTGFLDRTGDEIHTSMRAGPMVRKGDIKSERWILAYEDWNVDVGLSCGLLGKAQIGKGMWAAPDLMAEMLEQKIAHPTSGASCAWVPSPSAATLHATHYHQVDARNVQELMLNEQKMSGRRASLDDLLLMPIAKDTDWSSEEIQAELDNNAQGILGYVVRWVDQGVGCSKVPDINDVGLMEDRATCRISSQHIANWLLHGIVNEEQVRETMMRMAAVVDQQNSADAAYVAMAPTYDGQAFKAALELVLSGADQPSGYTEPILHARRLEHKA